MLGGEAVLFCLEDDELPLSSLCLDPMIADPHLSENNHRKTVGDYLNLCNLSLPFVYAGKVLLVLTQGVSDYLLYNRGRS